MLAPKLLNNNHIRACHDLHSAPLKSETAEELGLPRTGDTQQAQRAAEECALAYRRCRGMPHGLSESLIFDVAMFRRLSTASAHVLP